MAERSSGPVKPPVIDLTARTGARSDQGNTGARSDQGNTGARSDQQNSGARSDQQNGGARSDQQGNGSRGEPDSPEAGPAPSPTNDNPPRDTPRPAETRTNWGLLGGTALGGAVLGTALTYLLAMAVPLPVRERPMPPDLSADVTAQAGDIGALKDSVAALSAQTTKTQVSLDATIAQLDKGFADANAAIADVKAAIPPAAPAVDLAPLTTELTTLKARLDAIGAGASGGDATAIAQSMAALQTGLDSLSTRLNGTEASLTTLRSDVDAARKSLSEHIAAALPTEVGPALKLPLILSGLATAFDSGKPFTAELQTLTTVVPDLPIPDAVRAAAATGLPRPDALTQRFETILPQVLSARDVGGGDWATNTVDWAKSLLALRPAEEQEGDSPDAVISRLEGAMTRKDYAAAQALLLRLPQKMQDAAAPIATDIAARAAADELLVNLRARALSAAEATP